MHPQRRSRKVRRHFQSALRNNLLHRESQRCAISHNADPDMLTAAHILPFSVHPPDDHCWDMLRLFLGPSFSLLHQRYTGEGIDCLDNAWMLSKTLDVAFTKARCYLEPVTEPEIALDDTTSVDLADSSAVPSLAGQASYTFRWLEEPVEPHRYGMKHPTRPDERINSGDIITLRTVDTINYPLPNRYLLMIQAAVHKLSKEFKALADVFPDNYESDDEESICCLNSNDCKEDYWDQGYQGEGYWSRVQSWLDECPEKCAPVEGFLPPACSPAGLEFL